MQSFRRSLVALGVAAMVPTLVFAAVGGYFLLRADRNRIEAATVRSSQVVVRLVDARLRGDVAVLQALAAALDPQAPASPESAQRMLRIRATNPHWISIALFDAGSGVRLFDLRQGSAAGGLPAADLARLRARREPLISGIQVEQEPVIYAYLPLERHVLAAVLRPQEFQTLLLSQVKDTTAGVVDSQGRFIARTLNYQERVGKPATQFVRQAIAKGRQGLYRGYTYEGLKNYTAYSSSAWTGWSAHIAIPSSRIDNPTSWSIAVAAIAGLGSALLGGILVILILRDMAERRTAEEALRQAQKMEAVGQLTGGIAHDFNNLLTAVMGNLDLIHARTSGNERLQRLAANALEAARRGAKLSAQLLAFSRTQRMQLAAVDLANLLNGMSGLLAQSVGPAVTIHVALDPAARWVRSDANQLELALLNIAVNARDAMPRGGRLEITSRCADTQPAQVLAEQRYVELRIADTGVGMSEEVQRRALEPFFTTKPIGQGTGLGLSQVYGVMRESGGSVQIESAPLQGTTVCLFLPAASEAASGPVTRAGVTTLNARNILQAHILVVDDDEQVRAFIEDSLQSLGYEVTARAEPVRALELLPSRRFDLLIADFAMPGMNGAQLARAVQELQAGMPMLLVSGYADSAAIEAALGSAPVLRKPFGMAQLADAVADVLERSRARIANDAARGLSNS
jgi:signal transduction histidine kinase/CheY-like chemotaxis protein